MIIKMMILMITTVIILMAIMNLIIWMIMILKSMVMFTIFDNHDVKK